MRVLGVTAATVLLLALILGLGWAGQAAQASALAGAAVDLWVDPTNGGDANSGADRADALATVGEAWRRIPAGVVLTEGYNIHLVGGDYSDAVLPVYWEDRHGSAAAPIVVAAADGARSARLTGSVNMYNVDHLVFQNISFVTAGDVFHCEQCRHVTLRGVHMDGLGAAHETIKVNQSQYITIENSDIAGAYENAIDFVAVQHAWITGSRIHAGDDWCAYVKGGSAYITVAGNEIYDCGTGGFTAGQGTGFEYMTSPWLHYEVYDVRVFNNIIHDTEGAGLGVNGGYNVLLAYNTLYRVGSRSHVLEAVFGLRTCDGAQSECAARQAAGGWGATAIGGEEPIPNRNVFIYNNLLVNPAPYQSQWQQLAVYGPRQPSAGSNIPNPAVTDDNLVLAGNVIWNGPADHPLGVGDEACTDANPTCNAAQLLADNSINRVQPLFVDAAAGDWRLANAAALPAPVGMLSFPAWANFTPSVPAGSTSNAVLTDKNGQPRAEGDQVGALAAGAPLATATATATAASAATPTATATPMPTVTPTATQDPSQPTWTPTPTATYDPLQPTWTPSPTNTSAPSPTATATYDPAQPTWTPTATQDPSQPTWTPTPTATYDPLQPTWTPSPTNTSAPSPTATATYDPAQPTWTPTATQDPSQPTWTPTPTATYDPLQPTWTPSPTNTSAPSPTATATYDPAQPTWTPTATQDPSQPTWTPTPTATYDPAQPTWTPTPTQDPSQPTWTSTPTATSTPTPTPTAVVIPPSSGGTVAEPVGDLDASLTVPPGAVGEPITVAMQPVTETPPTGGFAVLGQSFAVEAQTLAGAPVTQFSQPLTLVVHYEDADLNGLDENGLQIHYWNETLGQWTPIPTEVDTTSNTLTIRLDHLTLFAVLQAPAAQTSLHLPLVSR